eukprot:scaffold9913_cov36-Cyclotella_meneghiniana.AAC.7
MKFINIAFSLLFVVSTDAASINKQFDEQVAQSYLRRSDRNVPGSPDDWLQSLNDARKTGQEAIGGQYSPFKWSPDLANQAQKWANTLASECKNAVPDGDENPDDYGVTCIGNARNPANTVERWMTNGNNAAKIPSKASNPMTQILWAGTEYVGCADAESSQSGKSCTAAVCYYAKAGNCAWSKYDTWEEAVLSGKACSKTCPSDADCPTYNKATVQSELDSHHKTWESFAGMPRNYDMTFERIGFFPDEYRGPFSMRVRDGKVQSATYATDGSAVDSDVLDSLYTVDDVFGFIQDALDEDYVQIEVTYDETTGYPKSYSQDISYWIADDEMTYLISDVVLSDE